jgi:hypothetical protein
MKVVFAGVLLLGLLVAGLALAQRTVPHSISQPSTQVAVSRDAEVVRYREMVNADLHPIDLEYQRTWTCKSREACISSVANMRASTDALLSHAATYPIPTSLTAAAQQMTAAAQQFAAQLDAATALMQEPNSNFVAAAAAPSVRDLDLAVAIITCWPVKPFEAGYHTNFDCS